jgi:hypothetical protein
LKRDVTPRPNGADTTLKADKERTGLIQLDPSHPDVSLDTNLPTDIKPGAGCGSDKVKPAAQIKPAIQSNPEKQTELTEMKPVPAISLSEPVSTESPPVSAQSDLVFEDARPVQTEKRHNVYNKDPVESAGRISIKTAQLMSDKIPLSPVDVRVSDKSCV